MFRTIGIAFLFAFALPANALVPSDPLFRDQYYLDAIGAPAAWDVTVGNPRSVVAVLDVGVDLDHPDLADAMWTNPDEVPGNGVDDDRNGFVDDIHGWDFVAGDPDPSPTYDVPGSDPKDLHHGTLVAGIIAARGNNGEGIAGVDWLARVMPLRVLQSDGTGDVDDVLAALRYARAEGATVVNLSFVGDDRSFRLDDLLADLARSGVLVVAAGGNADRRGRGNLDEFPAFPICSGRNGEDVLGVAATNRSGEKAGFSSYGVCVDLAAPGERIAGALFHDPGHVMIAVGDRVTAESFRVPYGGFFNGTSYAAPVVAGAASLLRGILPQATPREITALLQRTADPIMNLPIALTGMLGAGRVNLARAVTEAQGQAVLAPSGIHSALVVATPLTSLGERVAVRVELRDPNNRALVGRTVTLGSNRASDVVEPASALTDGNGAASFTVRATAEGIAELGAVADGATVATGRAVFAVATTAPIGVGSLLRGSTSTVYVIASDGKRYAFPDAQTFRSWVADASVVQRVNDVVLAAFPLGGLVTIRPGTFLVKIRTDPKVYAVEGGGTLRWISSEEIARAVYGARWATRVVDVPDAFFTTYRAGAPLAVGTYPEHMILEDASDGERYLVVGGQRRKFSSTLAFLQNGFQWRDVIHIPVVLLPDGPPITGRETSLAQPVP